MNVIYSFLFIAVFADSVLSAMRTVYAILNNQFNNSGLTKAKRTRTHQDFS